jgi:hypothetical protein
MASTSATGTAIHMPQRARKSDRNSRPGIDVIRKAGENFQWGCVKVRATR